MSDSIVRRLMETKRPLRFFEANDEDETEEEDVDLDNEEEISDDEVTPDYGDDSESTEEESDDGVDEFPSGATPRATSSGGSGGGGLPFDGVDNEDSIEGEELPEEPMPEETEDTEEYVNPLDNAYAVRHTIGDEVAMTYANGTNSDLKGIVDGYDVEGFYRVQWDNGMTTNGITDIALADIVKGKVKENKCVCGHKEFLVEGKYVVCDRCGRRIRESNDQLTVLDKSRPKGKRMIRSIPHPVSTANRPNIDIGESIKSALKKSLKEDRDAVDNEVFYSLLQLDNVFWSRESEMIEDIEELGYTVLESNDEYITVVSEEDDDDLELMIPVGGTSRSRVLDFNKAKLV